MRLPETNIMVEGVPFSNKHADIKSAFPKQT